MPATVDMIGQSVPVKVACRCEQEDQIHCFFAEITLAEPVSECEYRLQVFTEGANGRSRQSQAGIIEAGGTMPIHIGDIRVNIAEDGQYECICVVSSNGIVLASDTLRKP
jgi:hypothetical protein